MSGNNKEWRALIQKLRTRFPVTCRVFIRRCPMKKNFGITRFDGRTFQVRIDSGQPWGGQVDTMLHEWAHVRAIDQSYLHRRAWGREHTQIYEAWTNDFRTGGEK